MSNNVKFVLRTSEKIHARLKAEAERRKMSMNRLINSILEDHQKPKRDVAAKIKILARQL